MVVVLVEEVEEVEIVNGKMIEQRE